jgi:peptidoglycan hydrolase-like protein with peptidoglycan-binding domain
MGQILVVDYSFAHPDPAQIKAAGYSGVMRYLSYDPAKDITPAELLALHAVGLSVGLIWEAGATDELGAGPTGQKEGAVADAAAAALGWPLARPIYFAADFAASGGQLEAVAEYLKAASAACLFPAGIYGGIDTVDTMLAEGVVAWGWQTSAWSNGRVSAHAQLYQRQTPTLSVSGAGPGSFDENVALAPDWGGWLPAAAAPVNQVAGRPPLASNGNPWCPLAVGGVFGPLTTRALQWVCHVDPQDGVFGLVSRQALQAHLYVTEDGIVGPETVKALQARVGATQDGIWGSQTTRCLQQALNTGRF